MAPEFAQPLIFLTGWVFSAIFGYFLLSTAQEKAPKLRWLAVGAVGVGLVSFFPLTALYFLIGSFL